MAGDTSKLEGKVRFGVVGTGGMGTGHCNKMHLVPEAQLAAVCDVNPKATEELATKFGVPAFTSHIELLESGLVDAIIIATPHYFHPPVAIDAFERGIHVLSEKPLGVTVSAVDAMLAAAKAASEKAGVKFSAMFQMRSEPQNVLAKQIVASGQLGEIYRTNLVMGWYRSQAYYNSGGWRATWVGEGGGVLINQAPHYLDLFTWLGGLPVSLTAQVRTRLHDIEVEDEAFATLEYANGAHGYIYASTNELPNHNQLEVCGDKGKIMLVNGTLKHYALDGSIRTFTHENTEMWASLKVEDVELELPTAPDPGAHQAITRNFARAILFDEPLIAPGEEGLNAVELIDGIILSGKRAKSVSLPVDRAEYDTLIAELKASSQAKSVVVEQRVTDPNFAPA